jgi:hypothetical protein
MLPVDVIIHRRKFGDDNIPEEQKFSIDERFRVSKIPTFGGVTGFANDAKHSYE